MELGTISSLSGVFGGCCANMLTMESLINREPEVANLVTFLQFMFIAGEGFIFTKQFGTIPSRIPVMEYAVLVLLYFVSTVLNNYAYTLHVPTTLHIIIRSGSLPATLLVSWLVRKRHPPFVKIIGALLVAFGVTLATFGGAKAAQETHADVAKWSIGVLLLLASQVAGALTGLRQETLYHQYGSHPSEMLYYTHVLPLPIFFTMYRSLFDSLILVQEKWSNGTGWLLMLTNVITQYACVRSVHSLASNFSVLTVNLVLSLRKFFSLMFSVLIFDSKFTHLHFVGSIVLFLGITVYFDFFRKAPRAGVYSKKSEIPTEKKDN